MHFFLFFFLFSSSLYLLIDSVSCQSCLHFLKNKSFVSQTHLCLFWICALHTFYFVACCDTVSNRSKHTPTPTSIYIYNHIKNVIAFVINAKRSHFPCSWFNCLQSTSTDCSHFFLLKKKNNNHTHTKQQRNKETNKQKHEQIFHECYTESCSFSLSVPCSNYLQSILIDWSHFALFLLRNTDMKHDPGKAGGKQWKTVHANAFLYSCWVMVCVA